MGEVLSDSIVDVWESTKGELEKEFSNSGGTLMTKHLIYPNAGVCWCVLLIPTYSVSTVLICNSCYIQSCTVDALMYEFCQGESTTTLPWGSL